MNKKAAYFLLVGALLLAWAWRTFRTTPAPSAPPAASAVTAAMPQGQITQTTTTDIPGIGPVPTDPKELEKFKAKAKSELRASLRTTGIFFDRDDHKQAQDSGEMAWIFIEQRKSFGQALKHIQDSAVEPYQPRTLAALEHLLKQGEEAQLKLTAATLLYRYDQPAGKQYLLSVLNSPTVDLLTRDVALALARNKEAEAIPGIVGAFPKLGPPSTQLLLAMGRWNEPGINSVLRDQARLNPANWGYAFALMQGGDTGSIEPLTRRLAKEKTPVGDVVHNLEATLARYGQLDPLVWQQHLTDAFRKQPGPSARTVLVSFDIAGSMADKFLREMLASTIPLHEEFLAGLALQAQGVREKNSAMANKFPKEPPTAFIKGAAQLLAEWEAKEAVPTLQQVLTTVQKGNRADVYVNEALGLALYKLDPANWRETLLNAGVPEYHVDRIPALAKLRPIPAEYLPKQVNLKAR